MPVKFYMDHHVPRAITDGLRAHGVEVITALEDGTSELDDPELLDRAGELGCVLFTRDYNLLQEATRRQRSGVLSKVLSMLTNCVLQLGRVFTIWRLLQKQANPKTFKIEWTSCHFEPVKHRFAPPKRSKKTGN